MGGGDLDLGAAVALVGLPGAEGEPAGDEDFLALGEGLGGVLGQLAPHHDVEEVHRLVALAGAVGPVVVDRYTEAGVGPPARGEAQLGVSGEVACDGDVVSGCHDGCCLSVLVVFEWCWC